MLAKGFTLLEVMVAMFVLGFGLLALELVQLKTYTAAREAEYQTVVALHAESLAEAIRANPKHVADELAQFKTSLAAAFPHPSDVAATICPSSDLGQPLQLNNLHCEGSGPLAIKVAWRIKAPGTSNGRSQSFQLRFTS